MFRKARCCLAHAGMALKPSAIHSCPQCAYHWEGNRSWGICLTAGVRTGKLPREKDFYPPTLGLNDHPMVSQASFDHTAPPAQSQPAQPSQVAGADLPASPPSRQTLHPTNAASPTSSLSGTLREPVTDLHSTPTSLATCRHAGHLPAARPCRPAQPGHICCTGEEAVAGVAPQARCQKAGDSCEERADCQVVAGAKHAGHALTTAAEPGCEKGPATHGCSPRGAVGMPGGGRCGARAAHRSAGCRGGGGCRGAVCGNRAAGQPWSED